MLTKIEISNFKSFNKNFVFNLEDASKFTFNEECIKNGVVNKAIIYGHNGCGKSNLGFAIFDLVSHLTDKNFKHERYENYLNGDNGDDIAKFNFSFKFGDNIIQYIYTKKNYQTLVSEELTINGEIFASVDRKKSNTFVVTAKGSENLNRDLGDSDISIISYISKNTILEDNDVNNTFKQFKEFVNGMLYFRSLGKNIYMGIKQGIQGIGNSIIEHNNLSDFEKFLNDAGIQCKLTHKEIDDEYVIYFKFNNNEIRFYHNASSGTKSLTLFYFWYQRLKKDDSVSFLFIDEFDAFYHHSLSRLIIEKLKEITNTQIILTTHNTSIISNDLLRPDCYFLMDAERIRPLTQCTDRELREGHNIEKMYRANSFG